MGKDDDDSFRGVFRRMMSTFREHQWRHILACYYLQSREEQKARLRAVQELSVELADIKKSGLYATAFGDTAIEAVIQGDWRMVRETIGWLSFADEHEELRAKEAPRWEKFRALLLIACNAAEHRLNGNESPGRN